MKKFLTPALIAASAFLLYNCTGDEAETLDPAAELSDTLQPGDSVYADTVYPGGDYPVSDTIPQDSVYVPTDTISGDTITVTEPYPGDPETPVTDSVYTPTDSTASGQRLGYPRQQYLNRSFDYTKKP